MVLPPMQSSLSERWMSCRKPQGIIDTSVSDAMQPNQGKFLVGEILQLPSLHLTFYCVATIEPGILEVDTRGSLLFRWVPRQRAV